MTFPIGTNVAWTSPIVGIPIRVSPVARRDEMLFVNVDGAPVLLVHSKKPLPYFFARINGRRFPRKAKKAIKRWMRGGR